MKTVDVLSDGPFRYIHCPYTGELIFTLTKIPGGFIEYEGENAPVLRTLRQWKAIARKRIAHCETESE